MRASERVARETPISGAGDRYELEDWRRQYGVIAGVTGAAPQDAADYGLHSARPALTVSGNWRRFHEASAREFSGIVVSRQVHGTEIAVHQAHHRGLLILDGYDGHLTTLSGLLLAVTVADCIPVYMVVPAVGWVGLLHAGWRGAAAGILERGVADLARSAGTGPGDVIVHLGVGICGGCYEVGSEVARRLGIPATTAKLHVDLREVLAARARSAGAGTITSSPWCTFHDRAFWSFRRNGGQAGRMAAYLGRPST